MARNIGEVIDAMLVHVPEDASLRNRLLWLKRTASYKAPEQMADTWTEGSFILSEELAPPSEVTGWQAEVAAIWMNAPRKETQAA